MLNNLILGNAINSALQKVVDILSVAGGTAFTLAVMIIGLVIIFGSVSAAKMRGLWIALISCIAGAFIFFSASWFSGAISELKMTGGESSLIENHIEFTVEQ